MASFADLHRAVAATLASKRIGQPVFVRSIVQIGRSAPAPSLQIEAICGRLGNWFGQPFDCCHAIHTEDSERASFCLRSGNRALGLVAFSRAAREAVDLTLLGTHGAIYHPVDHRSPLQIDFPAPAPPAVSPARSPYGVLLIAGSHTHQEDYAQAFAADPRCRLLAVTDEPEVDAGRQALNQRLAVELGISYLPNLDAALTRPDVHVASICARPDRRGRVAVRCAEAGRHLYLDKSLAPTLEGALAVAAAVRKAGVRSQMFSFVTSPWARRAKCVVESGALGTLQAIHADTFFAKGHAGTVSQPKIRREEYPPQRHQLVEAKRELDNVGVYPITLIRWLTGRAFASVHALTANFFFAEHERNDVEDFGIIAGTLADGTPVTIAAGRTGWSSHPTGGVNRLVLVGSERTVTINANQPGLEVYTDEPPWTPPPAHPEDPMAFWTSTQRESGLRPKGAWVPLAEPASDVAGFLDCLDTNCESEVSASEAALATEVLLAAYKSAATGSVISLPLAR
jgi:predicted dehydrogenase